MSKETYEWLATNVLAGFSVTRRPWWANAAEREGHATNLFPEAVPMARVQDLLTSWQPVVSRLFDEDMKEVATHKLLKASDTKAHMCVIGTDHALHLYEPWLTGTVTECVGDEAQISSAGMLRDRCQAWVQIERPQTAVGPDGILFSPYVVLSTSLDGSLASMINQNTQMVVCDNTMEIGRNQGIASKIKHTSRSSGRLGEHRGIMAAIMAGESDFRAELERQLSLEVPDSAFERFLGAFCPIKDDDSPAKKTRSNRKRQEITDLYRSDPRVTAWKGTAFGVTQAVNTWDQHMSQLRNSTGYEMDDTNLRAMRNYSQRLRGNQGADMETSRVLESVLV